MNERDAADRLLTSHEVGDLLQVDPTSVAKWVNQGRITAFRTPGGHRRIRVGDLVAFLKTHNMPIPVGLQGPGRRRLLIVDDNEAQLKALGRLLKPYRAQVDVALVANGIDALVLVGAFKPHLIVLDVFMPELNGIEVCRRLKAKPETQDITVVIASAALTDELSKEALAAGADRCLPKPLDLAVVLGSLGCHAPDRVTAP
jgi:excisionase family DNA binding protein